MWGFKKYISIAYFLFLISSFGFSQSNFFIKNQGQIVNQNGVFNTDVAYLLSLEAYNVSFYHDHFAYESFSTNELDSNKVDVERIEVWFENSHSNASIVSSGKVAEQLNFYKNSKTTLNVNQFKKITYKNIWEGVDIEFFIVDNHLKYNYIVRNKTIKSLPLKIMGATPSISGNVITLTSKNGAIKETIPEAFFLLPNKQKKLVDLKIKTKGNGLQYHLPKNRTNDFVIDPIAYSNQYTTYYGGSHMDFAQSIVQNSANEIIVSGYTVSTNNIATTGAYQNTLADQDAFIAAFNQQGVRLWATYFGGNYSERIYSSALDDNDNIYIAGNSTSQMGVTTPGAYQQILSSGDDAFLSKFTSNGTLTWSTYYGGNDHELITAIEVDAANKVYITGHTASTDLSCTPNAYRNTLSGYENAFLGVFDDAGNILYNSYYVKGSNTRGEEIAITNNGTIYIAGYTNDNETIANQNIHQNQNGGYIDGFVLKISNQYNTIWKTYYGGDHNDLIEGMTLDSLENIYLTGKTKSSVGISTANAHQPNYSNSNTWDGFITKLDSSSAQQWGTYFDAGGNENFSSIKSKDTLLWLLGTTNGTTLATNNTSFQQTNNGGYDNIISTFSINGNHTWSSYFGGVSDEYGYELDFTSDHKILIVGQTGSNNNFVTPNAHQSNYGGHIYDGFWSILCQPTHPTILSHNNTLNICEGDSIEVASINTFASYSWSTGSTSNTTYLSTAGSYTLETVDNNNCPGKSDTLNVVIIPNYDLNIQTSSNAICYNDSTQLSTTNMFSSYLWNTGETSASIDIDDSQEYYVSVTNNFGCQYFSDTISLPISQHLHPIQIIGDTLICAGGTSILYTDNHNSIIWNNNANSSSISVNTSGDYYFSGNDQYGCPIISDTITINQINYDTPSSVLDTVSNFLICWNDSVTLTAANNFDAYLWSNGSNAQATTLTQEGFYYVSATDSNGCVGISDSIQISFKSSGQSLVHHPNGNSFCEGDSLMLHTAQNLSNIQWNNTSNNDSIYSYTPGIYFYTAIDDSGCSTLSDTITIIENSLPIVEISAIAEDSLCLNDSVFLSSTTSLSQYLWSDGSVLSGGFFNLNTIGETIISLTGTDHNNCQNQDSISIKVVDCQAYDNINEKTSSVKIKVTNQLILIEATDLIDQVELVNLNGQKVYISHHNFKKEVTIETLNIARGIYILNINTITSKNPFSNKIVIYPQ
jgi:hypothetical protein